MRAVHDITWGYYHAGQRFKVINTKLYTSPQGLDANHSCILECGTTILWGILVSAGVVLKRDTNLLEAINALVKDSVPNAHVANLFAFVILQNELQSIPGDSGIFVSCNSTLQVLRQALQSPVKLCCHSIINRFLQGQAHVSHRFRCRHVHSVQRRLCSMNRSAGRQVTTHRHLHCD